MKEKKTWKSAEAAALARACESMQPSQQRLFYDPWAKYFFSFKYSGFRLIDSLIPIPFLKPLVSRYADFALKCILWYMERLYPGGYGFVTIRTRYIDDLIQVSIEDGIDQLIILGSGFDARAYRIEGLKQKVKVFEVDQAGTMNRKTKLVKKLSGCLPEHVVYVVIDFETDDLADRLLESGYDPQAKSVFVCEAVFGYLTPPAVDETLRFIAENSGKGSSVIFDYCDISFIKEPEQSKEAATLHRFHKKIGERPRFGIDKNGIDDFLSKRGFSLKENVSVDSLDPSYFGPENSNIRISHFFHILHAVLQERGK